MRTRRVFLFGGDFDAHPDPSPAAGRPGGARRGARARARRAHPGARRRHRHRAPGARPLGRGLRRRRARGVQREPVPHPARRGRGDPHGLPRGRRRRRRDEHLRRHAAGARRVRSRRPRLRDQPPGGGDRAGRRGALLRARAAALRLRLDGPDDQGDLGHRRHHLRGAHRELLRPGDGASRRRRRLPAARDLPGHAQRQGGSRGDRARLRRGRLAGAGGGVGDDRAHRHHARRAGRRGPGGLAGARGPPLPGAQLCHRPGPDDRPRADPRRARAHPRRLRPERRPARRGRVLRPGTGGPRGGARPLRRRRLAEPGRRLLRHPRRARRGARPGGGGSRARGRCPSTIGRGSPASRRWS